MSSVGVDRETGRVLRDWDHVVQSLKVIFTTSFGERILRRRFGSMVPALIGRENITVGALLRFATAIIVAIELWEPRFKIRQITFPAERNPPETLRQGKLSMALLGEYRPRGHLGDDRPEGGERVEYVSL